MVVSLSFTLSVTHRGQNEAVLALDSSQAGIVVSPLPREQIVTLAQENVPMVRRTSFVVVSHLSTKVSLRG